MVIEIVGWGSSVSWTRADAAGCAWGSVDDVDDVCDCGALIGIMGRFEHLASRDGVGVNNVPP